MRKAGTETPLVTWGHDWGTGSLWPRGFLQSGLNPLDSVSEVQAGVHRFVYILKNKQHQKTSHKNGIVLHTHVCNSIYHFTVCLGHLTLQVPTCSSDLPSGEALLPPPALPGAPVLHGLARRSSPAASSPPHFPHRPALFLPSCFCTLFPCPPALNS